MSVRYLAVAQAGLWFFTGHVTQQLIQAILQSLQVKRPRETKDPDALGDPTALAQVVPCLAQWVDEFRAVSVIPNDANGFMADDGPEMHLVVV